MQKLATVGLLGAVAGSAQRDGSFTVTQPRNGFSNTYAAVPAR